METRKDAGRPRRYTTIHSTLIYPKTNPDCRHNGWICVSERYRSTMQVIYGDQGLFKEIPFAVNAYTL